MTGDLDLLNHVMVFWEPPATSDGESDMGATSETLHWAVEAGPITWTERRFVVIGIERRYGNGQTEYTLREA